MTNFCRYRHSEADRSDQQLGERYSSWPTGLRKAVNCTGCIYRMCTTAIDMDFHRFAETLKDKMNRAVGYTTVTL